MKVRSFAKPSEFWKNSQDPEQPKVNTLKKKKTIQVIDLEEDLKNTTEQINHTSNKATVKKDVVLKRMVPIPVAKILLNTPYVVLPTLSSQKPGPDGVIPRNAALRVTQRLVPLSSVGTINAPGRRPIAHITPQRVYSTKKSPVVHLKPQIRIPTTSTATNNVEKITPRPKPIITQSISSSVNSLLVKITSKVINPLAKRSNNQTQVAYKENEPGA